MKTLRDYVLRALLLPTDVWSSTFRLKESVQREENIPTGRRASERKLVGILVSMAWLKLFANTVYQSVQILFLQ